MTAPSLPKAADAERLTMALRRSGVLKDARVADVAVERSYSTILSHIFRVRLIYDGAAVGAPASLILKAGLLERPGGPWKAGQHEVAFYAQVASATPAGLLPRCFDSHWNRDTDEWHLLLEDLTDSHAVATRWPVPPTVAQGERIIRARARFQAAWWDDPRLGTTIGTWQDVSATDQSTQRLVDQYVGFAEELGGQLSPERRDFYARLFDTMPRLIARYHAHRHMTIVQGDAHVWNCFLPLAGDLDGARLFDWDAWRVDAGSDDLAYMMALHWYPEQRARCERHLLDCFHDELLANGVQGYDRRALEDDYRLSVLWQTTTPIWHHAVGIPPVIWWNNLERIHLAVDDLDCHALLAG